MAKNSITDYDNVAANNTDIQSVDIDEGCAPSGINNAIREVMADLADVNDGTVALTSPVLTSADINGGTIDGVTIGAASAGAITGTTITASSSFSGNLTGNVTGNVDGIVGGTTPAAGTFTTFTSNGIDDNASSTAVTIDSSGDVGIGTSSVNSPSGGRTVLEVNGTSTALFHLSIGGSAKGQLYHSGSEFRISSLGTEPMKFFVNSSERMRLESDGDLHVDGNIVAYSTTVSDRRLKKDIQPIENALWKVNQINGCTFTYLKDDRKSAGLIAQDLEKVLPSAVIEDKPVFHGEEGETYKTVQYDQVIGLLVEAIKELNAKVEGLKNGSSN